MSDEKADRVLNIALAEFGMIRDLISRKMTNLLTLLTFNITSIAAVSGFVLSNKADPRLLLVVPFLSSSLGILVFDQDRGIRLAYDYIQENLYPLAAEIAEDSRVLRWPRTWEIGRRSKGVFVIQGLTAALMFPAPSAIALAAVVRDLNGAADRAAWVAGATLLLLLLITWSTRLSVLWRVAKGPFATPSSPPKGIGT